jgi:hypothetical protein
VDQGPFQEKSSMLTEKDKQRIKEEEIFRADVQKRLVQDPPSEDPNKLLAFFQTTLGIWVLSTIVIGLFGWIYAHWQVVQQNAEQIKKLDVEIDARLYGAVYYKSSLSPAANSSSLNRAIILLSPPTGDRVILPEFANRNLKSPLYELRDRIPQDEWIDVSSALNKVRGIESEYLNDQLTSDRDSELFNKVLALQDFRWVPAKEMSRGRSFFSGPVFGILLLVSVSLLLLYALYLFFGWVWRRLHRGKPRKEPPLCQRD